MPLRPIPARVTSYLLGGFVCVQLVYLPLSNLLQRVPRRMDPLPDEMLARYDREGRATAVEPVQCAIDAVGTASDRWGELTGQTQCWSLFAPRFGRAGTFLTLQVRSADGTTTELRSRFEPADPDDYVRFDLPHYRLFYREMSYANIYWTWEPDSFETRGEEWREVIRDYVTTYRRSLSAYVRWRLAEAYAGRPVRDVTVAVRVFLPPKPGVSPRPEPVTIPMARWVPDRPDVLAAYDPEMRTFAEQRRPTRSPFRPGTD
jgi:hypothetical protein